MNAGKDIGIGFHFPVEVPVRGFEGENIALLTDVLIFQEGVEPFCFVLLIKSMQAVCILFDGFYISPDPVLYDRGKAHVQMISFVEVVKHLWRKNGPVILGDIGE